MERGPVADAWAEIRALIDTADVDALEKLLGEMDAGERAALVPALDAYGVNPAQPTVVELPPLEPEAVPDLPQAGTFVIMWTAEDGEPPTDPHELRAYLQRRLTRRRERSREWERQNLERQAWEDARRLTERRHQTLALALLCCVRTADDGVRRLHRPWSAGPPLRPNPDVAVPVLLRLRGDAWCASLARGMVRRVRRTSTDTWPLTEALLRAVGADPPTAPAAIAQYVAMWRGGNLAGRLAADPWFDHVVPYLFDEDVVAAALSTGVAGRDWPPALTELVHSGRLPRATVIAGCLRRLRAGGRAGLLQPYQGLLTAAAPTVAELAGHRQELIGLLPGPFLPAATFAHNALRDLDTADRLDAIAFDEITRSVLSRPEKKLIRAHLGWVRDRLAADPTEFDGLQDALVVGLHHPAVDLATATVELIARHLPANTDRLRAELSMVDGPVAERLAALLGTAPEPPAPVAAPILTAPASMPAPLDLDALASEMVVVLRGESDDPVRHELLLDGLARAARGDRAEAARVLKPLLPNAWQPWRKLIFAASGEPEPPPEYPSYYVARPLPLNAFVADRHSELAARLLADPPPALLATPGTVAGHADPARLLALLRDAERDGWQPGRADLTQALLRLPRVIDPGVRAGAERLASPAGREFASWLAAAGEDGEPATWIEEVPVRRDEPPRRLAMLAPGERLAMLDDPRVPAERATHVWDRAMIGLWPAIAPSHREVIAAHLQPIAAAGGAVSTRFLEGLALADGPAGPAMSSILANTLAAGREGVRLAAADAFLTLGARSDWTSTGVGTEVAALVTGEHIVLQRVVKSLTEVSRAGAHHTIWEVAVAALPALLPHRAWPGLADLVTLATAAARAGGHTAAMPELDAVAAKPGRGQLVVAARELAAVLTPR